jgi:hypothetical protein
MQYEKVSSGRASIPNDAECTFSWPVTFDLSLFTFDLE